MAKKGTFFLSFVEEPDNSLVSAAALAVCIRLARRSPDGFSEGRSLHSPPDFPGFGAIRPPWTVQVGRLFYDL
ncbi:hypothetical protein M513_08357 [Trichuris suis]|uniref:Uncharacterized protein n=1 Tax=Trichuris suis TaxID=68888 RepID=A0A085M0F5_9BILA|nr:hypothetical protein M513_08357 [Trichuris suis]